MQAATVREQQLAGLPEAARAYVQQIEDGDWQAWGRFLAEDAVIDASVPGWRYQCQGRDTLIDLVQDAWPAGCGWRINELHAFVTAEGAVVEAEVEGERPI